MNILRLPGWTSIGVGVGFSLLRRYATVLRHKDEVYGDTWTAQNIDKDMMGQGLVER